MKLSYKNINLIQRKSKGRDKTLKWLKDLKKVSGITRKIRRNGR